MTRQSLKRVDLKVKIEKQEDGTTILSFDKKALLQASFADLQHDLNLFLEESRCNKEQDSG